MLITSRQHSRKIAAALFGVVQARDLCDYNRARALIAGTSVNESRDSDEGLDSLLQNYFDFDLCFCRTNPTSHECCSANTDSNASISNDSAYHCPNSAGRFKRCSDHG